MMAITVCARTTTLQDHCRFDSPGIGMKRVGVFLLVGPLFGLVMALVLTARVTLPRPTIHGMAEFLMAAYTASLMVAFVSAATDLLLADKNWKLLGTTCVGAIAAVLEMLLLHTQVTMLQFLAFCLFGAVPAAVCSWVSGWRDE
jgi:hypothetical protein